MCRLLWLIASSVLPRKQCSCLSTTNHTRVALRTTFFFPPFLVHKCFSSADLWPRQSLLHLRDIANQSQQLRSWFINMCSTSCLDRGLHHCSCSWKGFSKRAAPLTWAWGRWKSEGGTLLGKALYFLHRAGLKIQRRFDKRHSVWSPPVGIRTRASLSKIKKRRKKKKSL